MSKEFKEDMKNLLTPFMNEEDIPIFKANCKFGNS